MIAEIRQLTNEEYHAAEGLSASGIKLLLQSPKKYHWQYVLGNKPDETDAMKFGTQFHMYCLEPELFDSKYWIVEEKIDKRTTKYKDLALAAFQQGREIISGEIVFELIKLKESLLGCPISKEKKINAEFFLKDGVAEQSIFWKDPETGVMLKTRPDYQNYKVEVLADLKTAKNACFDSFSKEIYSRGYFIQGAVAVDGVKALTGKEMGFINLVVEKEAPYCSQAYSYTDAVIEMGRIEYKRALSIYLKCKAENIWPDYESEMVDISIPYWAENKINYED